MMASFCANILLRILPSATASRYCLPLLLPATIVSGIACHRLTSSAMHVAAVPVLSR
jgi:hypothetical protein